MPIPSSPRRMNTVTFSKKSLGTHRGGQGRCASWLWRSRWREAKGRTWKLPWGRALSEKVYSLSIREGETRETGDNTRGTFVSIIYHPKICINHSLETRVGGGSHHTHTYTHVPVVGGTEQLCQCPKQSTLHSIMPNSFLHSSLD